MHVAFGIGQQRHQQLRIGRQILRLVKYDLLSIKVGLESDGSHARKVPLVTRAGNRSTACGEMHYRK